PVFVLAKAYDPGEVAKFAGYPVVNLLQIALFVVGVPAGGSAWLVDPDDLTARVRPYFRAIRVVSCLCLRFLELLLEVLRQVRHAWANPYRFYPASGPAILHTW